MDPIKKMILSISVLFLILAVCTPLTTAEENQVITDDVDDIIYTDALAEIETEFGNFSRPNVDIVKMTYVHSDNSDEATIILEVVGVIENANDFEDPDIDELNITGRTITYMMDLETSGEAYSIEYLNETCSVNGETASFEVDGSILSITLNLTASNETFVSLIGYSTEFELESLMSMKIYMDVAPNSALFIATIDADYTGETNEQISFSGLYDDLLELSTGPYTYTWDWDDGSPDETGQNPTHTFDTPIPYDVTLTIEDSSGLSSSATHRITISEGSSDPNNGNGDNDDDPSDDDGSSMMLFVGVVIVIVIIGVIALLVVIKRR